MSHPRMAGCRDRPEVYIRCVAVAGSRESGRRCFRRLACEDGNICASPASSGFPRGHHLEEEDMGFGRGALLWLLGVPLPIILLLALFWHH
jgi:hypothetical protein